MDCLYEKCEVCGFVTNIQGLFNDYDKTYRCKCQHSVFERFLIWLSGHPKESSE